MPRSGEVIDEAFGDPIVGVLVDDLRSGDAWVEGLSFVAEVDEHVVGHVMFTRSILDAPARLVDVWCSARCRCCRVIRAVGSATALVDVRARTGRCHAARAAGVPRGPP